MSFLNLKVWPIGGLIIVLLVVGATWTVQGWRYEKRLAEQIGLHQSDLNKISSVAVTQLQAEQSKRLVLEQQLSTSEQTHYRALIDAQHDQDRLRDRLATADVRLSVLLDASDAPAGCALPAAASTSGMDHGPLRARLDPAHAQRIIAITDEGDRGLIALQACQAYVKALGQ
ncbi:lysis system i-spanin subunit Rz [Pseudomonas corrugata]|uniref:lysis system i-spanin subunit Rz n=1 Tax=Pseudomonas corrugata TaxID=47879 RepID=UPI00051981EC|nr:lysis system i-spanin subunit Rz [Pseudomonas corrugata]MDU9038570.1 lysis system i-spanin subunit Rz [Pseudomonas corrugata]